MKGKKVEFTPPAELPLPEGTHAGERIRWLTEYEVKANGDLCIAEIEGVPMPGYEDAYNGKGDTGDEDKAMSDGFVATALKNMPGQQGGY